MRASGSTAASASVDVEAARTFGTDLEKHRDLSRTAEHAPLTTALIDLYKLYDKRRDTATIRTLRDRVAGEAPLRRSRRPLPLRPTGI
jgi:hypothetical protein